MRLLGAVNRPGVVRVDESLTFKQLLEEHGGKLAKLHGAVGWRELHEHLTPEQTCGVLARVAGLRVTDAPVTPASLLEDFAWERVETRDQVMRWTGSTLERLGPVPEPVKS